MRSQRTGLPGTITLPSEERLPSIMPHITDPAERDILAGFQRTVDEFFRGIYELETCSDLWQLSRIQWRFLETQVAFLHRTANQFRIGHSLEFQKKLDALLELIYDVIPDYPTLVDWDVELIALTGGAA